MDSFLVHVKEPTREQTVLDLVLSRENVDVDNVKVHSPLGQSDHSVVHFNLLIQISEKIWKTEYFDFRNGSYKKFKNYIE